MIILFQKIIIVNQKLVEKALDFLKKKKLCL